MKRAFLPALIALLYVCTPLSAETLKNPLFVQTGTPKVIAGGDFNRDGKPDLVYEDSVSVALHVLLGRGDGTFQAGEDVTLPNTIMYSNALAVADINSDGIEDILVGDWSVNAVVTTFRGRGDGTFESAVTSQVGGRNSNWASLAGIGVTDVNGDGLSDVIVSDALNSVIYVALGDSQGTFATKSTIPFSSGAGKVFVGDFNSDGRADFAIQGGLGADVTVYLGNGDGTFATGTRYTGPQNVTSVLLTDADGDGRSDFVITGFDKSIRILHGNADGTFTALPSAVLNSSSYYVYLVARTDVNGDGIADLIATSYEGISVLLGKADLTFSAPVPYAVGTLPPRQLVMSDFNNDGHQDFAVAAENGIAVLTSNANGTLNSADTYAMDEVVAGATVMDFNGDKMPDIAVSLNGKGPRLLAGSSTGKFSLVAAPVLSGLTTKFQAGDFNGDGKADLLLMGDSDVHIMLGNGDGTFGNPVAITGFDIPIFGGAAVGDLNGDGRSDVLISNYNGIAVVISNPNGTFSVSRVLPRRSPFGTPVPLISDVNGDGKPDFILNLGVLQVFLGAGDGTFTEGVALWQQLQGAPGVIPGLRQMEIADLDNDGKPDIVGTYQKLIVVYYGEGGGTFEDPIGYPLSDDHAYLKVADMDGDGIKDLVLAGGNHVGIQHGLGSRVFGPEVRYLAGTGVGEVHVVDVNKDGLPDVVVPNVTASTVVVLLSKPSSTVARGILVFSPEPSTQGQALTLTVALSAASGSNVPTGSASFYADDRWIATSPIVSGTARFTVTQEFGVGAHKVTANYSGDSNFSSAAYTSMHNVIPLVSPTTLSLTATPNSTLAGRTIRFTALVSASGKIPGGNVSFAESTTTLGPGSLNDEGVAQFDTALLAAGTHVITASYLGTPYFAKSQADVSVVVIANATSTAISGPIGTIQAGKIINLTATVTSLDGTPFGGVTFSDGSKTLRTVAVNATGTATSQVVFTTAGSHTVRAAYYANANFADSVSPPLTLNVTAAPGTSPTATALTIEKDKDKDGKLLLIATVATQRGTPVGNVTFLDGTLPVGAASVSNSRAVLQIAGADPGVHDFGAIYGGDERNQLSTSPVLRETVATAEARDFSLSFSSGLVWVGSTVDTRITAVNGFNDDVAISCTTSDPSLICFVQPATIGGGNGISRISILRAQQGSFTLSRLGCTVVLFGFVLLAGVNKPSRVLMLMMSFSLVLAILAAGCGSPSRKNSFLTNTVTINATSTQSGSPIHHAGQIIVRP